MNRGAEETRRAIAKRGLSLNQGADLVGADSGTFSKILRAKDHRKPGRELSLRIQAEFGVSPSLWDEELPDGDKAANADDAAKSGDPSETLV